MAKSDGSADLEYIYWMNLLAHGWSMFDANQAGRPLILKTYVKSRLNTCKAGQQKIKLTQSGALWPLDYFIFTDIVNPVIKSKHILTSNLSLGPTMHSGIFWALNLQ